MNNYTDRRWIDFACAALASLVGCDDETRKLIVYGGNPRGHAGNVATAAAYLADEMEAEFQKRLESGAFKESDTPERIPHRFMSEISGDKCALCDAPASDPIHR